DYLIQGLDKMKNDGLAAMVPKQSAFERYNQSMVHSIQRTIWVTGGCDSWYLDKDGIPNIYPWRPSRYRREMQNMDFAEFDLIRASDMHVSESAGTNQVA
ncbi:MAG: hypothetical protein ACSHXK_11980, partial [Oceanococcus sp.]